MADFSSNRDSSPATGSTKSEYYSEGQNCPANKGKPKKWQKFLIESEKSSVNNSA